MTESFRTILASMCEVEPDSEYIAVTLLGTVDGRRHCSVQTHFAGYTDERPRRELREASTMIPDKMIAIWQELEESHVVVNTARQLLAYHRVGGNALVERRLATRFHPEWVKPRSVVQSGLIGFQNLSSVPPDALKRAPTPKHRMRVLKRDGLRCKVCGRSPDAHSDVELHVHHIARGQRAAQP
jgi:hypothetical protein